DEALEAALLLHVVDASDPNWALQAEVTDGVLSEIGAGEIPRLRLFNKIDKVADPAESTARLAERWPDAIVLSARDPDDIRHLHARIVAFFSLRRGTVEAELRVPWHAQQL